VIGSASDMVGVWIEPVSAQLMMILFAMVIALLVAIIGRPAAVLLARRAVSYPAFYLTATIIAGQLHAAPSFPGASVPAKAVIFRRWSGIAPH